MGFALAMPSALAMVSAGAGLAGAGISGYGAYESGQAQSQSASYQSQVAKNNALIAEQNAAQEAQAGSAKEAAEGMKTRAAVGEIKAAQGASNIDVNSGSAASVRSSAAALGAQDLMTLRSNTAKAVYGYETQAVSDTAQSQLLQTESKQAAVGGDIGALGTFLSGASSVGSKWAPWLSGSTPPSPLANLRPGTYDWLSTNPGPGVY
jgi:hypothetical protein